MTMEALKRAGVHPENQDPTKQFAINQARAMLVAARVKDPGPKIETPSPVKTAEIKEFSRDQLILPEATLPQEVSDVLTRIEAAGFGIFEAYHLSGVTLQQDSNIKGWDKKPENWYWEQIRNGKISQNAAKLPDSWILIDGTVRPDYEDGKQLHENDPLGTFLAKLRKDKKIEKIKGISGTSRFAISPDELTQVVLPEIAKILGVESAQVRLPKEIEFNVIGNFKHPEWGEANTWEWFADVFEGGGRLFGGSSVNGGLTDVNGVWSGFHYDAIAFRPLVVVTPKA